MVSPPSCRSIPKFHCCMYGVTRRGSTVNRVGVLGSVSEVAGKPTEMPAEPGMPPGRLLIPGTAQSLREANRAGLAEAAPQGELNDCVTKNGGLKPGLGLE